MSLAFNLKLNDCLNLNALLALYLSCTLYFLVFSIPFLVHELLYLVYLLSYRSKEKISLYYSKPFYFLKVKRGPSSNFVIFFML